MESVMVDKNMQIQKKFERSILIEISDNIIGNLVKIDVGCGYMMFLTTTDYICAVLMLK